MNKLKARYAYLVYLKNLAIAQGLIHIRSVGKRLIKPRHQMKLINLSMARLKAGFPIGHIAPSWQVLSFLDFCQLMQIDPRSNPAFKQYIEQYIARDFANFVEERNRSIESAIRGEK